MASWLDKLIASRNLGFNPSTACWLDKLIASRPVRPLTRCCRFYDLKHEGRRTPEIRDIFNKAICPRRPSTRNLTRLLNLMDNRIGVTLAICPRWEVMEDAKALHIIRDMSGLPNKDYMHQPNLRKFLYQNAFGCTRVMRGGANLWFSVGLEGLSPGSYSYPGYFIRIHTPATIYHPWRKTAMDVKHEVLKITIPKKKGKWTRNIKINADFIGLQNKG